MLVASDALLLDIAVDHFTDALNSWLSLLLLPTATMSASPASLPSTAMTDASSESNEGLIVEQKQQSQGGAIVEALFPVLNRLCVLLASGKGQQLQGSGASGSRGSGGNNRDDRDCDARLLKLLSLTAGLLSHHADDGAVSKALFAAFKAASSSGLRSRQLQTITTACLDTVLTHAVKPPEESASSTITTTAPRTSFTVHSNDSAKEDGGNYPASKTTAPNKESVTAATEKATITWSSLAAEQLFYGVLCKAPEPALVAIARSLATTVNTSLSSSWPLPGTNIVAHSETDTAHTSATAAALLVELASKCGIKSQPNVKRIVSDLCRSITKAAETAALAGSVQSVLSASVGSAPTRSVQTGGLFQIGSDENEAPSNCLALVEELAGMRVSVGSGKASSTAAASANASANASIGIQAQAMRVLQIIRKAL
jgi:hypothetical protein